MKFHFRGGQEFGDTGQGECEDRAEMVLRPPDQPGLTGTVPLRSPESLEVFG